MTIGGHTVPFGTDLLFHASDIPGLIVHAEICEDVWVPNPPSGEAAVAGATILANLSASNITIGKAETRRLLCRSQSARCLAAYLYAAAGAGELTTDLAWDGQASVFENGNTLAETERFPVADQAAIADIDLDLLAQERLQMGSFDTNRRRHARSFRRVGFTVNAPAVDVGFRRQIERFPFVPADVARLEQDCYEAYNIQVSGLAQRMRATGLSKVVIGISGGLDSTQALLVCAQAFDLLGLPRDGILAYTMPGFATSDHTKSNAWALMQSLGATAAELDIKPAAKQMLADLGHPYAAGKSVYDITFENVQAGLRTDYLFRLANHLGGIVIGTGDLSELALGWCTYGVGDQMAHYNVNAGVPKTLIQHLIRWIIGTKRFADDVLATLDAILATEISPELVPRRRRAKFRKAPKPRSAPTRCRTSPCSTSSATASLPSKIAFMALHAWEDPARGDWPPHFGRRPPRRLRPQADPPLDAGLPDPLLRLQPVQAQRHAERTESLGRRIALPARRLARALGRQRATWLAELERNVPPNKCSTFSCSRSPACSAEQ